MSNNMITNNMAGLTEGELANQIYFQYHQTERELFRELDMLVNRVLPAHYLHGKETVLMLHRNISTLKMLLEEHFVKEEKELFREMRKSVKTEEDMDKIRKNIFEMEEEHKKIVAILNEIKEKTNYFTPPEYTCPTMDNLYTKLQELTDDFSIHIDIESKNLFSLFV